jgi:hypothetical protein
MSKTSNVHNINATLIHKFVEMTSSHKDTCLGDFGKVHIVVRQRTVES